MTKQDKINKLIEAGVITQGDLDNMKARNVGIGFCALCDMPFEIWNKGVELCPDHQNKRQILKRYYSNTTGALNDEVKKALLNDQTKKMGPFLYGKPKADK